MIVPLQHEVNLTVFHHRQQGGTQQRRFFVSLMIRSREQILVHQPHTPLYLRRCGYLTAEPAAQIALQVLRRTGSVVVLPAPEVLFGESDELHRPVGKAVVDSRKLRTHLCRQVECGIRIEVIGVVQQRAVVMVAVRWHERHPPQHGLQRLFKPAFPLPFAVLVCAGIYKIPGEHAEPCIPFVTSHRLGTQARSVDIFLVLNMTVGHIDETELLLILIRRAEMSHFTPMFPVTYAVRIVSARLEVFRYRLMTHITKRRAFVHLRRLQYPRTRYRIMQGRGSGGSRRNGKWHLTFCPNLYFTLLYTFVREPTKCHSCLRVTVDVCHYAVRLLFRLQHYRLIRQVRHKTRYTIVCFRV